MRVNTERYEWAHGKKPRGFGMWAFENQDGETIFATGTFTQAKKEAAAKSRSELQPNRPIELTVLP